MIMKMRRRPACRLAKPRMSESAKASDKRNRNVEIQRSIGGGRDWKSGRWKRTEQRWVRGGAVCGDLRSLTVWLIERIEPDPARKCGYMTKLLPYCTVNWAWTGTVTWLNCFRTAVNWACTASAVCPNLILTELAVFLELLARNHGRNLKRNNTASLIP